LLFQFLTCPILCHNFQCGNNSRSYRHRKIEFERVPILHLTNKDNSRIRKFLHTSKFRMMLLFQALIQIRKNPFRNRNNSRRAISSIFLFFKVLFPDGDKLLELLQGQGLTQKWKKVKKFHFQWKIILKVKKSFNKFRTFLKGKIFRT